MLKEFFLAFPKLIHFYLPVKSKPNKIMQINDKKILKQGFCKVIQRKQKDVTGRKAFKALAKSCLTYTDNFKLKKPKTQFTHY